MINKKQRQLRSSTDNFELIPKPQNTVETCSTDSRIYNEQFCWSWRKTHIFSLKLTRLINTDTC